MGLAGSSPSSALTVKIAPSDIASWNSVMTAAHPTFAAKGSFNSDPDLILLDSVLKIGAWSLMSVTLTTNWANVWRESPVVKPDSEAK